MINELPEGWATAPIPSVFDLNPPKPPAGTLSPRAAVSFVPMASVDAHGGGITNLETREFDEVRKGYTAFQDNDVILAKITPCFENGKAAVARNLRNGLGFGSSEFFVFRPTGAVLSDYLYHYLRQQQFRTTAADYMTGTAGQERVPADYLETVMLPVPPLAEQRRVVVKVEALLGETAGPREQLARVGLILKRFRQSVLAAACTGGLTEDWRASRRLEPADSLLRAARSNDLLDADEHLQDVELPSAWIRARVDALVSIQNGRAFPGKQYQDVGIRLLRPGNLHAGGWVEWNVDNTVCLPKSWALMRLAE